MDNNFLPNRQQGGPRGPYSPYSPNPAPGVPQSPFNSYNPTGGGQPNPAMYGQSASPSTWNSGTQTGSFGTSPALDQGAVWNQYAGVRAAAGAPQANTPPGGWDTSGADYWAQQPPGAQAAFDARRVAGMGGYAPTAPALDQNAVWNQYAPTRAAAGGVPPPPGAPGGTSTIGQGGAPQTQPLSNATGGMNPMQQMQQQLAQYGITPDMWQQLMQMFSNQSLGPNYSTGGN